MRDSYLTRLQKIPLEVSHSFFYSSLCHFLPPPSPPLHSSPLPLSLPIRRRRATTMVRASSSPPSSSPFSSIPTLVEGSGNRGGRRRGTMAWIRRRPPSPHATVADRHWGGTGMVDSAPALAPATGAGRPGCP